MRKSIKALINQIFGALGIYFLLFCVANTVKPEIYDNKFAWLLVILGALIAIEGFWVNKTNFNALGKRISLAILIAVTAFTLYALFYEVKRIWHSVILFAVTGVEIFVSYIIEWRVRVWYIERINKKLAELNGGDNE